MSSRWHLTEPAHLRRRSPVASLGVSARRARLRTLVSETGRLRNAAGTRDAAGEHPVSTPPRQQRAAGTQAWPRCSSLTDAQYGRSSHLGSRAPRCGPWASHHASRGPGVTCQGLGTQGSGSSVGSGLRRHGSTRQAGGAAGSSERCVSFPVSIARTCSVTGAGHTSCCMHELQESADRGHVVSGHRSGPYPADTLVNGTAPTRR